MYKLIISLNRIKDKIEILNSKIVLERTVIEKSLKQIKNEIDNMGIKGLSFKSIIKDRIE